MPATFSPDCMAVCIPPEQNETFTVIEDTVVLDDEGVDIISSSDTEILLPPSKLNGHILTTIHEHKAETESESESTGLLRSVKSTCTPLTVIPEVEDHQERGAEDVVDHNGNNFDAPHPPCRSPENGHHADEHHHHIHEEEEEARFHLPTYARTVSDVGSNANNSMLFHFLHTGSHGQFSGGNSQLLFQHFDAEHLEFEEAAAVRPKFIGHYLLGDCLGEGSYAKVKECLNTVTMERAAVKIFSPVKLKRIPNGMQNVYKEVNILRRLDHPNVCRMKELLRKELKMKLYLIMDYAVCAISDLTKSLPKERLPIWKAHYYFVQVLDGLHYCHSRGVIHKDLKPSNLVITTKDTLKIIDFGVAEQLSPYVADDMIGSSQGCPAVQPPQVADGTDRFSGGKLDVWSLGVTFFSLCVGYSRFPFVGETVYELFANICERPHELPEDLRRDEPEFCALIDRMLEKQEQNRPSVDDLRHHPWVKRNKPVPPAGCRLQADIEQALHRTTDSFLPYIQAYYHSSPRTSRAGSICCMTAGKNHHVPHHHHYPRCHSHHLSSTHSVRHCRQGSERRRFSTSGHHSTHNHTHPVLSNRDILVTESCQSPDLKPPRVVEDRSPSRSAARNVEQGCFSFKKWKLCRIT